jgi:hypothetical protein
VEDTLIESEPGQGGPDLALTTEAASEPLALSHLCRSQFLLSSGARRTAAHTRTLCPHHSCALHLIFCVRPIAPLERRRFYKRASARGNFLNLFFTPRPSSEFTMLENATAVPVSVVTKKGGNFETDLIVPLYAVIFILAVVGNSLVLITLLQNRRMRTVTNVFLLNLVSHFSSLAISFADAPLFLFLCSSGLRLKLFARI